MPTFRPHRRTLFAAIAGVGTLAGSGLAAATPRRKPTASDRVAAAGDLGLVPDSSADQTDRLQAAIDRAALHGVTLELPPGRIRARRVELRSGSRLAGHPRSVLETSGTGPLIFGTGCHGLRLDRLRIERIGPHHPGGSGATGLIEIAASSDIAIADLDLSGAVANGVVLTGCSGRVTASRIRRVGRAGLWSVDARGLEISGNEVSDCADNGILVWRSTPGEDGTIVSGNRVQRIAAASGGSGQHGNGINVFRAAGVRVSNNTITDCAFSAVRGNAASNIQITANSAQRIEEVALYAEFGFEGAVIASNVIDGAATGISVTNFNHGGRLAVIQGNLVRNLTRREHEPIDKRGEGIAVEADAAVSGNTIEGAPSAGIVIGWGPFMRNVAATGNVIGASRIGIMVTRDPQSGTCLITQNLISGARDGAVRLMDHGRPIGDDLTRVPLAAGRIVTLGNVVAG